MYSPITYNTDINSPCLNYLTGGATYGSGVGGNWSNNFSQEFLYTFGNGYARPGVNNYNYSNYNIFSGDNNWCNWQGGNKNEFHLTPYSGYSQYGDGFGYKSLFSDQEWCNWQGGNKNEFHLTPYSGYSQYGDGFGYKSLFSNQEWCNWHGKSTTVSSPSVSPTKEKTQSEKTNDVKTTPEKTKSQKEDNSSKINSSQKANSQPHKVKREPTIREGMVKNALKYRGLNEADGSWRQISNSKEWCADFIYHVIDETYKQQGKSVPKGLEKELPPGKPHHRVEELKQWGIANNKYIQTANKKNKGQLIAERVKPGDILILREDGASHTGFVTKVYPDGVFETIEGNRNDKVCRVRYSPNYHEISGFVQLR